jgi:Response regulator containing a CheY-like receiver domain and an HTH DNA-binding domain
LADDSGVVWLDDVTMRELGEGLPALSELSPREREVLDSATEGLSVRDMARRLSLSEATVRSHLSAIYSKLGVSGRLELLASLKGTGAPKDVPPPQSQTSPAGASPKLAKPDRRVLAGVVVVLLMAFATGAFLVTRPDLPPRTDVDTISALMAGNQITNLELRGQTLTVTQRSGERLRVENLSNDQWLRIQPGPNRRLVNFSASSDPQSFATDVAMFATSVLPLIASGAALVLVVRATRRPLRGSPAA